MKHLVILIGMKISGQKMFENIECRDLSESLSVIKHFQDPSRPPEAQPSKILLLDEKGDSIPIPPTGDCKCVRVSSLFNIFETKHCPDHK